MKQLDMNQRIDLMELEFYVDQATRWIDGTFDRFVRERPDMGNKFDRANWELSMAKSHLSSLVRSLS